MENLWDLVNLLSRVIDVGVIGILFSVFFKPFMNKRKGIWLISSLYFIVMMYLYFVPYEMSGMIAYGIGSFVVVIMASIIDKRNITQKIVLVFIMYLLEWFSHSAALIVRNILFALFINTSYMMTRLTLQFIIYVLIEILFIVLRTGILYIMVKGVHEVYLTKHDNVTKKELLMILSMLLTIVVGIYAFSYFSDIYAQDTGKYIWNVHSEYHIFKYIYLAISFCSMLIILVIYQKMKEKQKEEIENIVLEEQMENMKNNINEVERLYCDIRGLKHDITSHIAVLEQLLIKNEKAEFEKYFAELKTRWSENVMDISTGNPIIDVILTQRKKEADEKGIEFNCNFSYPMNTGVNAFDISVILNNAISNAFEGIKECDKPYISVYSYRIKNAYIIEIKNCIKKSVLIDKETELPETSKADKINHGYGLINIRKIANRYYGNIDIEQEENSFKLSVMLMLE